MSWPSRAALVLCVCLYFAPATYAAPVEFIAFGDMPYGEDQVKSLEHIAGEIADGDYPFVVHYGDIKAGNGVCSDEVLNARREVIYALLEGAVFYTPGDNDWTDCDRDQAGGFNELRRLDFLRALFFTGRLPSRPAWNIRRQAPGYPENARWELRDLVFVTLHIVGSDNGRHEIKNSDVKQALDAVDARDHANLAWLGLAFERARLGDAAGLVVIIHADPYDFVHRKEHEPRNRPCSAQERTACNPYLPFLERLTERADQFDRPVLLIHGSTAQFCLDRGFGGWRAPKLWRLNGPGDFVTIDAAVVRFDADAREPFAVHGLLSGDSLPACVAR